MKRGDKVKISADIRKKQSRPWGNDEYSGDITLKPGDILYHSSDTKLKGFAEGFTCFYVNQYVTGHIYAIKIIKEIKVASWNCQEEVKIDLDEKLHEIIYIGKVAMKHNHEKRVKEYDRFGRFQGYGPEVKIIDRTLKVWRRN